MMIGGDQQQQDIENNMYVAYSDKAYGGAGASHH